MEKVLCKVTNKMVDVIHQGFDIAIIKREDNDKQECVNVNTLNITKRTRPAKFKFN